MPNDDDNNPMPLAARDAFEKLKQAADVLRDCHQGLVLARSVLRVAEPTIDAEGLSEALRAMQDRVANDHGRLAGTVKAWQWEIIDRDWTREKPPEPEIRCRDAEA